MFTIRETTTERRARSPGKTTPAGLDTDLEGQAAELGAQVSPGRNSARWRRARRSSSITHPGTPSAPFADAGADLHDGRARLRAVHLRLLANMFAGHILLVFTLATCDMFSSSNAAAQRD